MWAGWLLTTVLSLQVGLVWPASHFGKKLFAKIKKKKLLKFKKIVYISYRNLDSWLLGGSGLPGPQSHRGTVAGAEGPLPLSGARTLVHPHPQAKGQPSVFLFCSLLRN